MRIAVYGGSFNPPHVAHAMVAGWLLWTEQVDAVWLVPVFRHAFEGRHDKALAAYPRRVAWCRALARTVDAARVHVSEVEASLPVPSYTVDTLRHLATEHPDHTFRPVMGADVLAQLDSWKEPKTILANFPPLVVGRLGYPPVEGAVVFPEVSSSLVRARLRSGLHVDHLVPAAVLADLHPEDFP